MRKPADRTPGAIHEMLEGECDDAYDTAVANLDLKTTTSAEQPWTRKRGVERAAEFLNSLADLLDKWAEQSGRGGWSTDQVDANTRVANTCRREAATLRRDLADAITTAKERVRVLEVALQLIERRCSNHPHNDVAVKVWDDARAALNQTEGRDG